MERSARIFSTESPRLAPGSLALLARVRDTGGYSSRNTSKGALLKEGFTIFRAMREGNLSPDELRELALRGQMFPGASFENRQRIWDNLHYRYFAPANPWITASLAAATTAGATSPGFLSLAYLYFALRDRFTFDVATRLIWERWRGRSLAISTADALQFLDREAENNPAVKRWNPSTRAKLAPSILAALRDFGVLRGVYSKQILRPVVSQETVFHLVCVLIAEGLHGRSVIEAPDWRLFLWTEDDAAKALTELAQRRWIRFERGGRTVILELVRMPGVGI